MSNTRKKLREIECVTQETEVLKGIINLSDKIQTEWVKLLSIWGMTPLQYDALRVLYVHDKDNKGLPSGELGRHIYTRVPDVTRLLDRLEDKSWVARERDTNNRRVVRVKLRGIGIQLVESAYGSLNELDKSFLSDLSSGQTTEFQHLMSKLLR